jgi:hypothetical protein
VRRSSPRPAADARQPPRPHGRRPGRPGRLGADILAAWNAKEDLLDVLALAPLPAQPHPHGQATAPVLRPLRRARAALPELERLATTIETRADASTRLTPRTALRGAERWIERSSSVIIGPVVTQTRVRVAETVGSSDGGPPGKRDEGWFTRIYACRVSTHREVRLASARRCGRVGRTRPGGVRHRLVPPRRGTGSQPAQAVRGGPAPAGEPMAGSAGRCAGGADRRGPSAGNVVRRRCDHWV